MKKALFTICSAIIVFLFYWGQSFAGAVYNPLNGHYYEAVIAPGCSWDEAVSSVAARGGNWYLATITDAYEQAFIENMIAGMDFSILWLGGYQYPNTDDPRANWRWVTEEPWNYANWDPNEPNDYYGPGSESYLAFLHYTFGYWNDDCGGSSGYIAECDGDCSSPVSLAPAAGPAEFAFLFAALLGLGAWRIRRA